MINTNELYIEVRRKWKSLYPIYFDSTKSLQQGRRLPKALCVQTPTIQELARAVGMCRLRHILEPQKCYSRDYFSVGRLKVELVTEDGKPMQLHIPTKQTMLREVARQLKTMRQK